MIFLFRPRFGVTAPRDVPATRLGLLLFMASQGKPLQLARGSHYLLHVPVGHELQKISVLVEQGQAGTGIEETGTLVIERWPFSATDISDSDSILWIPGERRAGVRIIDSKHPFLPLGIQTPEERHGEVFFRMALYYAERGDQLPFLQRN